VRKTPLISLKKKGDFKRVFNRRKSAAGPLFVVYAAANDLGFYRLGISVSKKVGYAVVRSRVKRLVRESCRHLLFEKNFSENDGQAFDLIIIARAPVGNLPREGSFAKVNGSLVQLFGRLGVLTK